jgi:hypothetical protein
LDADFEGRFLGALVAGGQGLGEQLLGGVLAVDHARP